MLVEDARQAHDVSVAHGARSVLAPQELADAASGTAQVVAEVALYGDVVLRYVSGTFQARRTPAMVQSVFLTQHYFSNYGISSQPSQHDCRCC